MIIRCSLLLSIYCQALNLSAQQNYFNIENWTFDTLVFSNLNVVLNHPNDFNLVRININKGEHHMYSLSNNECISFPIIITIGPNLDCDIIIDKNEVIVDGKEKSITYGVNYNDQMIRIDKYKCGVLVYYSNVPESHKLMYDFILGSFRVYIH